MAMEDPPSSWSVFPAIFSVGTPQLATFDATFDDTGNSQTARGPPTCHQLCPQPDFPRADHARMFLLNYFI